MAGEPTKFYVYCNRLYERMDSEAVIEENLRVWRGRIIATCKDVGIPEGTYSKVVNKLRSIGCVEQISRGYRGTALATFILHYPPTPDRLDARSDLTDAPSYDRLAARIEDVTRQLGGINVVSALHNLEQRIQKLESKARDL
jgi:hypothetical protein